MISVGDAVWDVDTARQLMLPFVGVGDREQAERLWQAGASHILTNYLDFSHCLDCFAKARMPNKTSNGPMK